MAVTINIPIVYDQEDTLSLGGIIYKLRFTYNERDNKDMGRWRITLSDEFGNTIFSGIKLLEVQDLLGGYKPDAFEGSLLVMQMRDTPDSVIFDNIGIGKDYELWYLEEGETLE